MITDVVTEIVMLNVMLNVNIISLVVHSYKIVMKFKNNRLHKYTIM